MELGPILRALRHNKVGPILVCLQIAFTLAVVVNAMFLIATRIDKMDRPLGIDKDNIFNLTSIEISTGGNVEDFVKRDLLAIRSIPGVVDATPVLTFLHSGSARAEGYSSRPDATDAFTQVANVNFVDEHGLEALGIGLLRGRNFRADEVEYLGPNERAQPTVCIVTETMGRTLFGDEEPLGQTIYYGENNSTMQVIGVINDVAVAWMMSDDEFARNSTYNFMLQPFVENRSGRGNNYVVRTQPGLVNQLIPQVERVLFALHDDRLIERVRTQNEILERSYGTDSAITRILMFVACLMVLMTGLGIVGLASFTVNQRRRQIGTRRALGATQADILRYFIVENLMLTTFGVVLGALGAYGLHIVLYELLPIPKLDIGYIPAGMVLLYLLGLLAVYGPARRAALTSPGVATRAV